MKSSAGHLPPRILRSLGDPGHSPYGGKPTVIRYSEVLRVLENAFPSFQLTEDDREEPAPYFFLADLIQYICHQNAIGSRQESERLGGLFERLTVEGDSEVRDLVADAMDVLWESPSKEEVAKHFKPHTAMSWKAYCDSRREQPAQ